MVVLLFVLLFRLYELLVISLQFEKSKKKKKCVAVTFKMLIMVLMCRLGLKLLSRVKPSEIFFKSIPKEIDRLDIIYPSR